MASKSASPKTTTPWGHLSQMDTHLRQFAMQKRSPKGYARFTAIVG
jgi:hypothetical protein